MKKLISLILSVAVVLTSFTIVGAYSDVAETEYAPEIAVLSDLGIIKGYEDGSFKPDAAITRAEVVAIINRMQGLEDAAKATSNVSLYSDVKATDWFAGDVNLATQMGVISGDGNGKFRPNDQVKYEEAVKMVVAALGYNQDYVMRRGGWPTGYLVIATENEISKGLSVAAGTPAVRDVVAKLVFNALTAPTFSFKEYSTDGKAIYEVNKTKIVLEEKLQTYKIVGYVTDNTNKDTVRFMITDEKVGKVVNGLEKGSATLAVGDTNIADTLGCSLVVYVVENVDGDFEVISYFDNRNEFTVIDDDDDTLVTYADNKIGVYNEDVDTTTVYYDLATNPVFVVNGEIVGSWTPNGGVITLVDNNRDGKVEYVHIEIYDITIIEDIVNTANSKKIYAEHKTIDLDKYDANNNKKTYSITLNGKPANLEELAEDDIIAVADTDSHCVIKATRNIVEGMITEYSKIDEIYVVDGVEYKESKYLLFDSKLDTMNIGDEVAFYLDIFGNIAYAEKISSAAKNYGFVVGAGKDVSVGDTAYQVKLLDKNGDVKVYDFADKVKYNGTKTADTVYDAVYNGGAANTIYVDNALDAANAYANRIITYKTNSANKITELDFVINNDNTNKTAMKTKYNAKTRTFIGGCAVDENTVVFNLPVKAGASKDNFEILTIASLSHEDEYEIAFLDIEDNVAGIVVITNNDNQFSKDSNWAIATKVMATQNSDYDNVQSVTFIQNGVTKTLITTVDVTTEIKAENVFEYALNEKGEINAVHILDKTEYKSNYDLSDTSDKVQYVYGRVYSKSTNRVITIGDARDAHAIPKDANIYLVDLTKNKNRVANSSYSEIREYGVYENEVYEDYAVFMKYYNDEIIDVVVYKSK